MVSESSRVGSGGDGGSDGDGGKTLGGKGLSLGGGLVDGDNGTVGMGNKPSKVAMGIGGIAGVAVGGVGQGGGSAVVVGIGVSSGVSSIGTSKGTVVIGESGVQGKGTLGGKVGGDSAIRISHQMRGRSRSDASEENQELHV